MKRSSLLLSAFLFSISLFAQEQELTPKISAGSKSIYFSFKGFGEFGIQSAPSGGIGAKYFFTDNFAFRGGFSVNSNNQTSPNQTINGYTPPDNENKSNSFQLTLGGQYFLSKNRVSPYLGATVSFTYGSNSSQLNSGTLQQPSSQKVEQSFFGFGAGLILGAEVFIFESLSLGAEYILSLNYSKSGDQKYTTIPGPGPSDIKGPSSFQIGTSSVGALLNFYF